MRADKFRNTAAVLKEVIKNPALTEKEVSKRTGLGAGTVHRAMKELEKSGAKDDRLSNLLDTDLEIEELAQAEIKRRLSENPEEMNGNDIKGFSELSMKRRAVFGQKKDDGGDREIIVQI